jgi:hypothetical protein
MSGVMVLPGGDLRNEIMDWGVSPFDEAQPVPTPSRSTASSAGDVGSDSGRLGSSRLMVVRWVPAGSYHVSMMVRRSSDVSAATR